MEFDCYLCGRGFSGPAKWLGCEILCEECQELKDQEEREAWDRYLNKKKAS